ncbi:MAG: BlaI/MecI/CopY family transcriptional regulator [Lawsonibacter sp.]|jgi:BlaI family penicillinase repressor|nr:BlaI/MecI/CopY family transcriptional regulator [Lawsonibacter sp.]
MDDINLTNSEWYVLDCLWTHSPMTVMELVAALGDRLGWAKSTTITTLRRMEDKGLVHCTVEGRGKHYAPAVRRDRAVRRETRSFLDKVYQGSVGLMVSALAQDKALSKAEIDELYEILRKAEEGER